MIPKFVSRTYKSNLPHIQLLIRLFKKGRVTDDVATTVIVFERQDRGPHGTMPVRNGRKRLALVVTRGRARSHPNCIPRAFRAATVSSPSSALPAHFIPSWLMSSPIAAEHERVANARSIVAAVRFSHAPRSPHNPAGMNFESDSKTNSQLRCHLSRSRVKSH
jgi:hypothetical protein